MEPKKIITIKNLSHYFEEKPVLKGVSACIYQGDFVFLTGPTGSGKTTLIKILHGDIVPTSGIINIDGYIIGIKNRNDLYKLRRKIGIIYQDFFILEDLTVEQNILLPVKCLGLNKKEQHRRLNIVLNILELKHLRNTICKKLSGGEKQRVAIGRAIISNPSIILADEPTGSLDQKLTYRLMQIFLKLNSHGTTVIVATHNLELIKIIKKGRIFTINNFNVKQDNAILK